MGWTQFILTLTILLGVALAGLAAILPLYEVEGLYLRYAWGPTLEREFGFAVEERNFLQRDGTDDPYLVISSTVPGGVLDRSGVVREDVPLNCHHGCTFGFYSTLMAARRGETAWLRLLNSTAFAEERGTVREVTIATPERPHDANR